MKKRSERQESIRQIVRDHKVRTQNELTGYLKDIGFDCTQATVSRDITNMGLLKSTDGYYLLPEDDKLRQMVSGLAESAKSAGNLVVVKTAPGGASGVAGAIDSAGIPHVVGSVAGDDAIMIATSDADSAQHVCALLQELMPRR